MTMPVSASKNVAVGVLMKIALTFFLHFFYSLRYPLFSPCKCSGSIGLTHQDCLASWLQVQRLDGRCELCSTKFRFAPQYAEGAPEQLPLYEVILGLSRSAVAKWLPWGLRIATALGLWLFVVPLATAYSYIGWLHSPSAISKRWHRDFVLSDTISGAVIAGIIVISFLSLMSFADFLRFNFQQGTRNRENIAQVADVPVRDEDIDDVVLDHNHIARRQRKFNTVGVMDQRQPVIAENRRIHWEDEQAGDEHHNMERLMEGMPNDPNAQREVLQRRIRAAAALQRRLDALDEEPVDEEQDELAHEGPIPFQEDDEERIAEFLHAMEEDLEDEGEEGAPRRQNNFEPQFEPMNEPMDQGANQDDMEMNLALDEILGLRGPFGALIRNILWFMAFVMTYLGIFAFVPRFVGSTVYKRVLNTTEVPFVLRQLSSLNVTEPEKYAHGLAQMVDELNTENNRLGRTLQLNDLALLVLGYLSMALLIVSVQSLVGIRKRMGPDEDTVVENNENEQVAGEPEVNRNDQQPAWDNANNFEGIAMNDDAIEIRMTLGQFLSMALDCSGAFVKVGVLLFFKMILLPLVLGVWLDAATLSAFGQSPSARILYAGNDLFSSMLVHWVVGITFMLVVTVSVLQLREVVHPGLLARVIRPQEPQPDLLGNLLNESVATHTKRMVLSFGIYAFLLTIYVWLPARILLFCGADSYIPFLRPKFWYLITPQLQVPLELLVFHLTMLGFLEKYKNSIGGLQHGWLILVCKPLGLTDYMLPQSIQRFVFVGWKAIFVPPEELEPDMLDDLSDSTPGLTEATNHATHASSREEAKQPGGNTRDRQTFRNVLVDPFWYELATTDVGVAQFVEAGINIVMPNEEPRYVPVRLNRNGKCTVDRCKEYIRVPLPSAEQDIVDRRRRRAGRNAPVEEERKNLIASTLGEYRLRRSVREDGTTIVEFWKECTGNLIARPPEGWDDLGVGGAEVQGRWAWGNEHKSIIEEGVAVRNFFFGPGISRLKSAQLMGTVVFLLLLSWVAIITLAIVGASTPLVTGRIALLLLRLPGEYVHDPFAFAVGLLMISSAVAVASQLTTTEAFSFGSMARSFRLPPRRKAFVVVTTLFLWVFAIPFVLGLLYDLLVVKSQDWFIDEAPLLTLTGALRDWGSGFILLNGWAYLCFHSVFTKQFWVNFGNAAFEADGDNANAPNADPPDNANGHVSWQGSENGRIARFFNVLQAAMLRGQWDRVDPDVLLVECVIPIAMQVGLALCVPIVSYGASASILSYIEHHHLLDGVFQMFAFRALCATTIGTQCLVVFRDELQEWFKVVHKTARDDGYLIGEVLLNYSARTDN
jgi:E3 ubiquitin-protein ligase MARCH6